MTMDKLIRTVLFGDCDGQVLPSSMINGCEGPPEVILWVKAGVVAEDEYVMRKERYTQRVMHFNDEHGRDHKLFYYAVANLSDMDVAVRLMLQRRVLG